MDGDDLDPRELERLRRRDREADAKRRELMRPGLGKVYKQVLDAQRDAAVRPPPKGRRRRA